MSAAVAVAYFAGIALIYRFIDPSTLEMALRLPWSLVLALLGLSLVNYAVRGWRWLVLSRHMGVQVPLGSNLLYYFSAYAFTTTPGKAGEAVRLWFLKSGHGIAYTRSLPLMLADRIIDAWAVLLLSMISIAGFSAYRWHGLAAAAVVALVSAPVLFPRRIEPLLGAVYGWLPRRGRLLVRVRRLLHAMADLSSWRTYGLTLVPTIAGWLAEAAGLYLLLRYFGTEVGFVSAVFVFSFAMIVGAISMMPGGLGSTEATMVILLNVLGVDLGTALAVTAIVRIATFWFAVLIGVLLMPPALGAATRAGRLLLRAA